MRIIRFTDEKGAIRAGTENADGGAREMKETDAGGYEQTGRTCTIKNFLAPIAPAAIFCIGLNYRAHAEETGSDPPRYPVVFMKNPAAVIGPGEPIVLPECCKDKPQVDFEAELAVVIGRAARNVTAKEALSYVKGYTAANDVSARSWQKHAGGGQWVRGKSFDTFCPLGPALITPDEILNPDDLGVSCVLNGETMQESRTSDMIFPVSELIAFLSEDTTLLPNTVILTGTPSGVGFTRRPPVYLKAGDRLETTVEKIGTLGNPVV